MATSGLVPLTKLKKSTFTFDRLKEEITKVNAKPEFKKEEDPRFWQPTVDEKGVGQAVIRFLPPPPVDGDDALPWARILRHAFEGPGGWYVENSLRTLNLPDPVAELNSILWKASDNPASPERKQASAQRRKLTYISNIYVVSDPKNPEAEGRVFLFRFGKKIFDKITSVSNPEFEDQEGFNPFDFQDGANFRMRIRNVDGFRNYDASEFDKPSPLSTDEDELVRIWNSEYSLKEFTAPDQFKSYEDLKARLDKALTPPASPIGKTKAVEVKGEEEFDLKRPTKATKKPVVEETPPWDTDNADEDDDLAQFRALADDDD